MKKTTKGALAAGAAAVILLGGAGTLAYWTDDATVDAGTLSSGTITLTAADCGTGWTHTEDGAAVALLVPGDTIELECDVTLTLTGDHIGAELEIVGDLTETGPLASALEFSDVTLTGTGVTNDTVSGAGTYDVTATVTANFPYGTVSSPDPRDADDNSTVGITAEDLGAFDLVAVQTHEN